MIIGIAQIDSTIGDFALNTKKIIDYAKKAASGGAHLVLFPELAICGYPPMDLLDQDNFVRQNIRALHILQQELPPDITVGVGYVNRNKNVQGKALVNAYSFISGGALIFQQVKTLLPTYDVFDEARNFEPASTWRSCTVSNKKIGIAICEDVWRETETPGTKYAEDPVRRLLNAGIDMLIVPSASPYFCEKHQKRLDLAKKICYLGNIPLIYINAVGANDSIIFDGRSFFMDSSGNCQSAASFNEDLLTINTTSTPARLCSAPSIIPNELDTIEDALVLGICDYMAKCGFKKAHLGLSGGIDSSLVAYLAAKAIGAENLVCISMPSRFSSQGSKDDAKDAAKVLGCRYETIPIETVFTAFLSSLEALFEGRAFDVAEENLQARIRGTLLMAFSNKWNSMLLTTGNKSELAMGYCTLYGDMNGALAPIGDLFKSEVFALCKRINTREAKIIIPEAIIEKPPSAELRENQKDQDSLPPYDLLDEILSLYLFDNLSAEEIADRRDAKGNKFDFKLVKSIIKTVARAEFKRRQAPPVLKVSQRAFGMGRRMPIARSLHEI